jgi:hypothetical protein
MSPLLGWHPHENIKDRNAQGERERKMLLKSHCESSSILSDSHGPRSTSIKSIGNLHDMWPMIGATFLF